MILKCPNCGSYSVNMKPVPEKEILYCADCKHESSDPVNWENWESNDI